MKTKKSVVVKPIRKVHEPEDKYDTRYEETRFAVFDAETGEMLDDAQGYGYRTAKKAWAAWTYKNRDKSKDREKARKKKPYRIGSNRTKVLSVPWRSMLSRSNARNHGGRMISLTRNLSLKC